MLRLDDLLRLRKESSPVQTRSMARIRVLSLSQSHVSFPIDEFFDIAADPRDVLVRQDWIIVVSPQVVTSKLGNFTKLKNFSLGSRAVTKSSRHCPRVAVYLLVLMWNCSVMRVKME